MVAHLFDCLTAGFFVVGVGVGLPSLVAVPTEGCLPLPAHGLEGALWLIFSSRHPECCRKVWDTEDALKNGTPPCQFAYVCF